MKTKRILAICLVIILSVLCLSSCGKADRVLKKADKAMESSPYKVTYDISFTYDNNTMAQRFYPMNETEIVMLFDGQNSKLDISSNVSGIKITASYTAIEDTVYIKQKTVYSSQSNTETYKVIVDDEQKEELFGQSGASVDFKRDDIIEYSSEKNDDGEYVYTCYGFTESMEESFIEIVTSALDEGKGEVKLENAVMKITVADGKYKSAVLFCDYLVNPNAVGNKQYPLSLVLKMDFEYDDIITIEEPEDLHKYNTKDYDQVFGK